MRILLTGGSGFIGTRLRAHLLRAGHVVDAPPRARLDLEDATATTDYVTQSAPAAILHLASPAIARGGWSDAGLIAREAAVAQTLIAAAPPGSRFLQAGSMAEIGRSGRHREGNACTPITVYGRAKHAAAEIVRKIAADRGIEATSARIFGAYGAGEAPHRLFPHLLGVAEQDGPIALSDAMQRRDFIHVDDVCAVMLALLDHPGALAPVYNVGTGRAVTVRAAIERIAREADIAPDRLAFGTVARSVVDEDWLEADTTLLETTLGWCPPQRFLADQSLLPLLRTGMGSA